MILVISKEVDSSTNRVIDWLLHYGCEFIRINAEDKIVSVHVKIENGDKHIVIATPSRTVNLNEVDTIWYRKNGVFFDYTLTTTKDIPNASKLDIEESEIKIIKDFIHYFLQQKTLLGNSITFGNLNKLIVLDKAQEIGFRIPKTVITSQKSAIPDYPTISKAISEVVNIDYNSLESPYVIDKLLTYTVAIPKGIKSRMESTFFPVLFQEQVQKAFEIRVFHLNGTNHSMAIFSQKNNQTQVDFRKYDYTVPNRTVPYKLPKNIDEKVNKLMKELELDTGSIDLLYDEYGEFYFLEINPVGQFGMVSKPCNYYLDRKIAQTLQQHEQRTKRK